MSDKFFVGLDITSFENNGTRKPISRVTLWVDDNNCLTAGDDTGFELEADCPFATQTMVNNILSQVSGYQYQAYYAGDANIDPSAELGDGVTANGIYSVISSMDDDGSGYPSLSAPGEKELEDEYPAAGPMTQEFNRQLSQTRSQITKTAEDITLMVENEINGLSSSISIQIDGITSTVQNQGGQITQINQYVNGITLSVSNSTDNSTIQLKSGDVLISSANITFSGVVTFTDLSTNSETTVINGANIRTGTISADRLNLQGAIKFSDLNEDTQKTINDASSNASDAISAANSASSAVNGWTYQDSTYIDGKKIMSGTVYASYLMGGNIGLLNASGTPTGAIGISGASTSSFSVAVISLGALRMTANYGAVYIESGYGSYFNLGSGRITAGEGNLVPNMSDVYSLGQSSLRWANVYSGTSAITTSDRELKNNISYDISAYDALFDKLQPVSFKYDDGTSGRTHLGMISQDVEEALADCGMLSTDFAGFIKSPKTDEEGNPIEGYDYALRYEEFIPMCIWQIAALKKRVSELEAKVWKT